MADISTTDVHNLQSPAYQKAIALVIQHNENGSVGVTDIEGKMTEIGVNLASPEKATDRQISNLYKKYNDTPANDLNDKAAYQLAFVTIRLAQQGGDPRGEYRSFLFKVTDDEANKLQHPAAVQVAAAPSDPFIQTNADDLKSDMAKRFGVPKTVVAEHPAVVQVAQHTTPQAHAPQAPVQVWNTKKDKLGFAVAELQQPKEPAVVNPAPAAPHPLATAPVQVAAAKPQAHEATPAAPAPKHHHYDAVKPEIQLALEYLGFSTGKGNDARFDRHASYAHNLKGMDGLGGDATADALVQYLHQHDKHLHTVKAAYASLEREARHHAPHSHVKPEAPQVLVAAVDAAAVVPSLPEGVSYAPMADGAPLAVKQPAKTLAIGGDLSVAVPAVPLNPAITGGSDHKGDPLAPAGGNGAGAPVRGAAK